MKNKNRKRGESGGGAGAGDGGGGVRVRDAEGEEKYMGMRWFMGINGFCGNVKVEYCIRNVNILC